MKKFFYSNEIAAVVKQFLDADDWHYSFDENRGIFDFGLRIRSKIQKIKYLVDVKDGEIKYKSFVDCNGVFPSTEVVKNSIYCIDAMYKRYAHDIVDIIFAGALQRTLLQSVRSPRKKN